ncbi:MAG TPA: hypothetical protein VG165_14420 [Solirubrobacteraceae bacterium]|nr:hypothetical protein [Solirubrobacteraceae bacterium]
MPTDHASTAFFTTVSLVLAVLVLVTFRLIMARSPANRCIAGFVACLVSSPLMLVAHVGIGIGMLALGLACAVPACLLAEDHDDDGRGGGGSAPIDSDPGPGSDPDLWDEFEREFWSHVARTREVAGVR